MKNIALMMLVFISSSRHPVLAQNKESKGSGPQRRPAKNHFADSMRRVSMGQDTTRALWYNEQGKPMDTVPGQNFRPVKGKR